MPRKPNPARLLWAAEMRENKRTIVVVARPDEARRRQRQLTTWAKLSGLKIETHWDSHTGFLSCDLIEFIEPSRGHVRHVFECGQPAKVKDINGDLVCLNCKAFMDNYHKNWGRKEPVSSMSKPDGKYIDWFTTYACQ